MHRPAHACRRVSLSSLERQLSRWFWWWSLINLFGGGVIGGGLLQQVGAYLANPGLLLLQLGTALPGASNFFLSLLAARALFTNAFRLLWPHMGSMISALWQDHGASLQVRLLAPPPPPPALPLSIPSLRSAPLDALETLHAPLPRTSARQSHTATAYMDPF